MTVKTKSVNIPLTHSYRLELTDVVLLMLLLRERQDFCKTLKRDSPSEEDTLYWEREFLRAGSVMDKLTMELPTTLRPYQ